MLVLGGVFVLAPSALPVCETLSYLSSKYLPPLYSRPLIDIDNVANP